VCYKSSDVSAVFMKFDLMAPFTEVYFAEDFRSMKVLNDVFHSGNHVSFSLDGLVCLPHIQRESDVTICFRCRYKWVQPTSRSGYGFNDV